MNEITLRELMTKLSTFEETYLVELLQLRSEDLVERFQDFIEDNYDELIGELEQDRDEQDDD